MFPIECNLYRSVLCYVNIDLLSRPLRQYIHIDPPYLLSSSVSKFNKRLMSSANRVQTALRTITLGRSLCNTFWGKSVAINNIHKYYVAFLNHNKLFFTTSHVRSESDSENETEDLSSYYDLFDDEYEKWTREILPVADCHSVFVIQPYIKWGNEKKRNTSRDLQLSESVALVESLKGWRVVDKMTLGLKSFEKKTLFGTGNINILKKKVNTDCRITAVFVSIEMLRGVQLREMRNIFNVPVFDRYTIVIQLFRQHAISGEAKLQVAMAEIPYLRSRLGELGDGIGDKRSIGGHMSYEAKKNVIMLQETKIKQALNKLRNHRQLLRSKRSKIEYPTVAVVGYTNAGKTSLIKALTGDESMRPENRLFATLDISTHMGILPCKLKVLYIDTIGFISDIPTNLIESFVATLEDALLSDVILHVKDISHPDRDAQAQTVEKTLRSLHLPSDVLENIIIAENKQDLVNSDVVNTCAFGIPVSSVSLSGIGDLKMKIQETILDVTNRLFLVIRVPMGGEEASWLYKEVTVIHTEADPKNSQYLLMHTIITQTQLYRFQRYFVHS